MYAFTRPSHQRRQKVRAATLRSMHHTSIYKRLILQTKTHGADTATTGTALNTRFRENSKEGTNLLKLIHGQLYSGKLANDTDMPQRTNVPYATAPTCAHTLQGSAKPTKTSRSAATPRNASSYTLQSETPPNVKVHSIPRRTYV